MSNSQMQPAEWARQRAVWIGWPSDPALWADDLGGARAEVEDLVRLILFPNAGSASDQAYGEPVRLVASGADAVAAASIMRARLPDPTLLEIVEAPIGDVWLRDTGPIFVKTGAGDAAAVGFSFNGWGGKYQLGEDHRLAALLAARARTPFRQFKNLVAEGGALDTDGRGTFLTTEQCLLNENRNPALSKSDIEKILEESLGAKHIIWLKRGLVGDHTDGHVDNIARFVAPGHVVCMRPFGDDDPNAQIYDEIEQQLRAAVDVDGAPLKVTTAPSPGRVEIDGEIAAASHLNFLISNRSVIVPTYAKTTGKAEPGREAVEILKSCVDRPYCFGLDSSHLLTGGGSFHCITQQQPT